MGTKHSQAFLYPCNHINTCDVWFGWFASKTVPFRCASDGLRYVSLVVCGFPARASPAIPKRTSLTHSRILPILHPWRRTELRLSELLLRILVSSQDQVLLVLARPSPWSSCTSVNRTRTRPKQQKTQHLNTDDETPFQASPFPTMKLKRWQPLLAK